jgi:hypothetical protein
VRPADEQVTVTGHVPSVVFEPIRHVDEADPRTSAVVGPNPCAFEGPDLYMTTILQAAPGLVVTVAVAELFLAAGEVREVNARLKDRAAVGSGVGRVVGAGSVVGAGVDFGL